jgi:hypothetical protein
MSIFRKASELNDVPASVTNAFFEKKSSFDMPDEFEGLFKEASSSSNKSVYENRLKEFQKLQKESHEFTKPEPTRYAESAKYETVNGIRRASYGQRFSDEESNLFVSDKIRSINYDNNRYASNDAYQNGFSIWEPEFDTLQQGFEDGQRMDNKRYDRVSVAEKQAAKQKSWEQDKVSSIRQAKVLPYRGLGITRIANEQPLNHGDFGSVNEFAATAHDTLVEMTRQANRERKASISRQGFDPDEAKNTEKEAVQARTMKALNNASWLSRFAEEIDVHGL